MKTTLRFFAIILCGEEGRIMENRVKDIETVIDYIESHLDEKLDLDKVSEAAHYSK